MSYTKNAQKLLYWLTRYKITVQQLVARVPLVRQRGTIIKSAITELLGGENESNFDLNIYYNDKFDSVAVLITDGIESTDVIESELLMDGSSEVISFFIPEGWYIAGITYHTEGRGEEDEDRIYCLVRQGESEDIYDELQEDDNSSIVFGTEDLFEITGFLDFFFIKADDILMNISDYHKVGQYSANSDSGFYGMELRDLDGQILYGVDISDEDSASRFFLRHLYDIYSFVFTTKMNNLDLYALELIMYFDDIEEMYVQQRFEQEFSDASFEIPVGSTGVDFNSFKEARVFFNFAQNVLNVKMINNGIEGDSTSGFNVMELYDMNNAELVRTINIALNTDNIGIGVFDMNIGGLKLYPKSENDLIYEVTFSIMEEGSEIYNDLQIQSDPQQVLEFIGIHSIELQDGMTFQLSSVLQEEVVIMPTLSNLFINYSQGRIFVDSTGDNNLTIKNWAITDGDENIILQSNYGSGGANESNISTTFNIFPDYYNPGLENGTYYLKGFVVKNTNQSVVIGETDPIEFTVDNAIITDVTFNPGDETFKMSFDTKGRVVGCIQIWNDYNGSPGGNVNMAQVCGFGQFGGLVLNGVYEDYDTTPFNLDLTPYDPGNYYISLYMDNSGYSNWFSFTKPGEPIEPDVPTITNLTSDGRLSISANSNGKISNSGKIYNDDMSAEIGTISFTGFLGVKSFLTSLTSYNNNRGLANGTYNLTLINSIGESEPTEFILDNPTIDSVIHNSGSLIATFDTKGKTVSCIYIFTNLPENGGYPIVNKCGNISPALNGSYTDHDLSENGLNTSSLVVGQTYYAKMEFQEPGYTDYVSFIVEEPA